MITSEAESVKLVNYSALLCCFSHHSWYLYLNFSKKNPRHLLV